MWPALSGFGVRQSSSNPSSASENRSVGVDLNVGGAAIELRGRMNEIIHGKHLKTTIKRKLIRR